MDGRLRREGFEDGGDRPAVTKERAQGVADALRSYLPDGAPTLTEDDVRALAEWIEAVAKRLPSEAAVRRDRERRKAKG